MTGTLPIEISKMTKLEMLDLSYNFFSGTLPAEWTQSLARLEQLDIIGCMLTGELPSSMEQLTRLERLFLPANNLNGTLPVNLASIPTLSAIFLSANQFSGTLPDECASSTTLTQLRVAENRITGTIPTSAWLQSENLTELALRYNSFTGTIPSQLGSLSRLVSLLVGNSGITGTIPTELGNLGSTMDCLYIENSPTVLGTIPTGLGMLRKLTHLLLHDLNLSGTIPDAIATPNMILFSVYNNPRLTGSLPDSFNNISPAIMWLEITDLSGNITSVICDRYQPDDLIADCEKVVCPCCNRCHVNGTYLAPSDFYV